jgi:hypothetical protein
MEVLLILNNDEQFNLISRYYLRNSDRWYTILEMGHSLYELPPKKVIIL